jgi:hypothetical protein
MAAACPVCRAEIPLVDINVGADAALCRACGHAGRFSDLVRAVDVGVADTPPPRFVREERGRAAGDLLLTYRRRSPALWFLVPFFALWGGGSLGGIYVLPLMQGKTIAAHQALFGLPFLFGSLILLSIIVFLAAGRRDLRLTGRDLTIFVGVGGLGWTRRARLASDTTVSLEQRGAQVNNRPVPAIVIRTEGQEVAFGAFMHDESKTWLAGRLMRAVRELR